MEHQGIDFEAIVVGDELGPVSYAVSHDDLDAFLRRVDDPHPWYREDSPFGGPVVPPGYTAGDYYKVYWAKFGVHDAIHAEAAHEYLSPARVGDTLTVRGVFANKFVRRGRQHIVIESTTTNQHGKTVVRSRNVIIINASRGVRPETTGGESANGKGPSI